MGTRQATRAAKALAVPLIAPATVLSGVGAAGAEPATSTVTQEERSETAALSHCNSAPDYRQVLSAPLVRTSNGAPSNSRVTLWYSSTTRCVYGKFISGHGVCNVGDDLCGQVRVRQNNGYVGPWHHTADGHSQVVTERKHDAGLLAAAEAEQHIGAWNYWGKTGVW
jgi:hypothetical protein